jgi:hypothetical protein
MTHFRYNTDIVHLFNLEKARNKVLTVESMNESVKNVEYAVRGELAIKAENLRVVKPFIRMFL